MQVEVSIRCVFDPRDTDEADAVGDALARVVASCARAGIATDVTLPAEEEEPPPAKAAKPVKAPKVSKTKAAKITTTANGADAGDPFGDTDEEEATPPPVLTPAEQRDAAIEKLTSVYGKPGGSEKVRALQKRFKLAKFKDLPLDQASALLAEAEKLVHEFNPNA